MSRVSVTVLEVYFPGCHLTWRPPTSLRESVQLITLERKVTASAWHTNSENTLSSS